MSDFIESVMQELEAIGPTVCAPPAIAAQSEQAAAFLGMPEGIFLKLVEHGRLPEPILFSLPASEGEPGSVRLWLYEDLRMAFYALRDGVEIL